MIWDIHKERKVTKQMCFLGKLREDHQGEWVFYLGPEGWESGHSTFKSESGHMPKPHCMDSDREAGGRGFQGFRQILGPNVSRM